MEDMLHLGSRSAVTPRVRDIKVGARSALGSRRWGEYWGFGV